MEPIENSKTREAIRVDGIIALNEETSAISAEIKKIEDSKTSYLGFGVIAQFIVFLIVGELSDSIGIAFLGAVVFIVVGVAMVSVHTSSAIDEKKSEISRMTAKYDKLINANIAAYNAKVKRYYEQILKNPSAIMGMTDHTVAMFQRMIAHADNGSYIKFIESGLTYCVGKNGISYYYNSGYSNNLDNFDFIKERYRTLDTDAECEALAKAIGTLTYRKMLTKYPPASTTIQFSHMDAEVTIKFHTANPNFVPSKAIFKN